MAATSYVPTGLTIRSAEDGDWPAMSLLAATCFGGFRPTETTEMWRTIVASEGTVIACDGTDVVGMTLYLDLRLTVPGGAVLPAAGVSWVAVAPTHRRRGLLREMLVELHRRMASASYPVAGLEASEGGIYGRFGYGPATIEQQWSVERSKARLHADVADPGGVRVVRAVDHRDRFEDIFERWRLTTPGGLHSPRVLWDEVLADREVSRHGGSALFALLHADGFAFYRARGDGERKEAAVTKLVAVTPQAHIALWRALLGLDLMDTVTVETHPSDPLPYVLTDARAVCITGSEDALWLRLIDIPAALQARSYAADLSMVLDVTDATLGGGGRFSVQINAGRAVCLPTDAPADVHTDLSVLGSLYLGTHRASAFAVANRLRSNDAGLISQLDAALASDVPAQLGYGF